jgi:hypothetical protein
MDFSNCTDNHTSCEEVNGFPQIEERKKERKKELKNKRTRAIGRKKNGAN